jgi:hypothetical protein
VHGSLASLPSISAVRKRAPKAKLPDARRRALIEKVIGVLRTGDPTVFELEGACRAGLRSGFCLEGVSWALADIYSENIVAAALRRLGAKRPTWYEGQPDFNRLHASGRVFCANPKCQKPIEREGRAMYCCEPCRTQAKNARRYREYAKRNVAYAAAQRAAARKRGEERACEWCGSQFKALDVSGKPKQRFCGLSCRSRFASSCSATWRPARLPAQKPPINISST